jgi:transcriptional regulator with XRE-family HTH domain
MTHVCTTLGCYLGCLLGDKLTQRQLSNKLGVTPQSINNWINNKRRPDRETLLKLCVLLNGVPEEAFKLADYEISPLEKSWYWEMQSLATPRREEYERFKRFIIYLRQLMKGNNLQIAIDFCLDLREMLNIYVQKDISYSLLLFDALDNLSLLYFITCSRNDIKGKVFPIIKEMKNIQKQIDDRQFQVRVLGPEAGLLHEIGLLKHSELIKSLKLLNVANKVVLDINQHIDLLRVTCIDTCLIGTPSQFEQITELLESKLIEYSNKIDISEIWLGYEKLAISNATMWDRFKEKKYFLKSKEMFDKAKVIYDIAHQKGDFMVSRDINMERGELRLAFSNIIELSEEEKINKAQDILTKCENIGNINGISQMKEYITSQGKIIPEITD